jgi:hypothetical protein
MHCGGNVRLARLVYSAAQPAEQNGSGLFLAFSVQRSRPARFQARMQCHPNSLRAISPLGCHVRKHESAMDNASHTVKLIIDAMVQAAGQCIIRWREAPISFTSTQQKPLLKPTDYEPVAGPLQPLNSQSRTAHFVSQCAQKRPVVEVRNILHRSWAI